MKQWPNNDQVVDFTALVNPLVEALKQLYELKRINRERDVEYKGFDIGSSERATCLSPDERLTAENLEYEEEEKEDEAIEAILTIAVHLGIEQGRRMEKNKREEWR